MTPAENLLSRLRDVRPAGRSQWRSRCPSCDARTALSIREESDGRVLMHCFGGCSAGEVLETVGLSLADLFDQPLGEHRGDPKVRPPKRDAKELLAAAAADATTAAVIVSDVARSKAADSDQALKLAILAGRLHKFVEVCR